MYCIFAALSCQRDPVANFNAANRFRHGTAVHVAACCGVQSPRNGGQGRLAQELQQVKAFVTRDTSPTNNAGRAGGVGGGRTIIRALLLSDKEFIPAGKTSAVCRAPTFLILTVRGTKSDQEVIKR